MRTFLLGLTLYLCPRLFAKLGRRWFPSEFKGDELGTRQNEASIMQRRFWRAFMLVLCAVGVALVAGGWLKDSPFNLDLAGWLRVAAVVAALTAALGRGGWAIQSWDDNNVTERIDKGMYVAGQLGAAMLLIFVLTL